MTSVRQRPAMRPALEHTRVDDAVVLVEDLRRHLTEAVQAYLGPAVPRVGDVGHEQPQHGLIAAGRGHPDQLGNTGFEPVPFDLLRWAGWLALTVSDEALTETARTGPSRDAGRLAIGDSQLQGTDGPLPRARSTSREENVNILLSLHSGTA